MANDTAGDPMSSRKWSRKSIYTVSDEMEEQNLPICPKTVSKLLKKLAYSLKCNRKEIAETQHADRNQQFEIIAQTRALFEKLGLPMASVDMKKKELIGNFKNAGKTWCKESEKVSIHDFRSHALGVAYPYGIYEPLTNRGLVVVGTSYDTPEFAVEAIAMWLKCSGVAHSSNINHFLILCDAGGSNGYRPRAWKYYLYQKICQTYGMKVTVCHYPSGASKWNPIEHRMFSFISLNWAGTPLRSYETMLRYIQGTTTSKGLEIEAMLHEKEYERGIKISDKQMQEINISKHEILPQWNYTIAPNA